MPLCCVGCKPCDGVRALFKCRRPTFQLRRAFGRMKVGGGRRRRRAGSFSSVRAVFWPLMSMRSDVDDRPPSASTDDSGARAPSPSLADETPREALTTAARVLALQARLGEAASPPPATTTATTTAGAARSPSPARDDAPGAAASTTAGRVLALQARLGENASPPKATATTGAERLPSPARDVTPGPAPTTAATRVVARLGDATTPLKTTPTNNNKAGSIRVQAAREHAKVVDDDDRDVDDVEEACRSFEKHLMEMLVEERKVVDLTDVEELLCCWDKLKSPVFVQLVGRFYGELCVDLFFSNGSDAEDESTV